MIISERIFCVMEQKNITQLELSRRTGIATSNISDWKKKKTNPKADCLLSICDALEITPEQLLTGKGIDPEYKDADMDYEVTRSDIKILKQIPRNMILNEDIRAREVRLIGVDGQQIGVVSKNEGTRLSEGQVR